LVQLPLPANLPTRLILDEIDPYKDVDGLTTVNTGRLMLGENPIFTPCTPMGIIELIKMAKSPIAGKRAVVVGRSAS
jgi:methylenetetrahydrofolate dehydrogenase (NADP+)/methenyltetrahydrofolate cyclohydrolase